jgi:hypothetical protein
MLVLMISNEFYIIILNNALMMPIPSNYIYSIYEYIIALMSTDGQFFAHANGSSGQREKSTI